LVGKCSRCGKEKYPLYMIHNPVSQVLAKSKPTKALKLVDWVCEDCLTPGEKWRLVTLPKIKRELQAERTEKPEVMLDDEFNYWLEKASTFACPFRRTPESCDDWGCDLLDDCIEHLKAKAIIHRVMEGEIRVIQSGVKPLGKGSWEAPV